MKKIFAFLNLSPFEVSVKRKRVFWVTVLVLAILILLRSFDIRLIESIPYGPEFMAVFILTLIINVIASVLRLFAVSRHRKRRGITGEEKDNFTVGANALVLATTSLAAVIFIFIVLQIEFKSFLTSIALFAVALTMIFQDFVKNFLQGLSLMFSADYEIGDYIQVASLQKGVIRDITFTSTHLRTDEGNVLYIPNVTMRSSEVINYSQIKYKKIDIDFTIQRGQIKSLEKFETSLFAHIEENFITSVESEKLKLSIKEATADYVFYKLETSAKKYSFGLEEKINKVTQTFAFKYTGK